MNIERWRLANMDPRSFDVPRVSVYDTYASPAREVALTAGEDDTHEIF